MKIPGLSLLEKIIYNMVKAHYDIKKEKADIKALTDRKITADPYNPIIPFKRAQK